MSIYDNYTISEQEKAEVMEVLPKTHKDNSNYVLANVNYDMDSVGNICGYIATYSIYDSSGNPILPNKIARYTYQQYNEEKKKHIIENANIGQPEGPPISDPYSGMYVQTYVDSNGKRTNVVIDGQGNISFVSGDEDNKAAVEASQTAYQAGLDQASGKQTVSKDSEVGIINIPDNESAACMLDRLSRISDKRRVEPLSRFDTVLYRHRHYYDKYNLQIGDTQFMVPPEFILVTSEAQTGKIVTLRQENTQKTKSGYHRRTVMIDLVAHGSDQINGFAVEGPDGTYYMDGIRPLLAQFKRTPFLPIFNELINDTYGIHTVALQSITIQTVENFPNVMTAQITLQEMNMMPYIEMHSFYFQFMIDWDLMRFYYQRALTEEHEYKKLQSIPINKEHNHLIMRALSNEVLADYSDKDDANGKSFLEIVKDKNNYDIWIDSSKQNFSLLSFSCNYSNMLANVQMSEADSPTVQFMGGMDTIYNIVFETTDYQIVRNLEQCRINNDLLTRSNPRVRSLGFVMLESELVEFTGSLFVMIDTVTTNTVPGFPGLYHIQVTCIAYDIGQSEREQLNGFKPFTGDAHNQLINQSEEGVYKKIQQDLFAEAQIIRKMEVYPDLHLPTYAEVDAFITKCISFRSKHKLSSLPYTSYPRQPYNMLHGCSDIIDAPGDAFHPSDITVSSAVYDKYVDPDFYVFYHVPYTKYIEEIPGESPQLSQRSSARRTKFIGSNSAFYTADGTLVGSSNDDIVDLGINIICNNEGTYNSVVANDNGGLSIGKMQWHNGRALDLMRRIVNKNVQEATSVLGTSLVSEIKNQNTTWNGRKLTSDEVTKIKTLLGKTWVKPIQDEKAEEDMNRYVNQAMNYGLTDTASIIYYADCVHQWGEGQQFIINAAKATAKEGGGLDTLHKKVLNGSTSHKERRIRTYQALQSIAGSQVTPTGSFQTVQDTNSNLDKYTLSKTDYEELCKMVMWIVDDGIVTPTITSERLVAQSFFDRIVDRGESIDAIKKDIGFSQEQYDTLGFSFDDTTKLAVRQVFMEGKKQMPDSCIFGVYNESITDDSVIDAINKRCKDAGYEDAGYYNSTTLKSWIKKIPSNTSVAFMIEGEDPALAESSVYRAEAQAYTEAINNRNKNIDYTVYQVTKDDLKYFGEPVIARNSRMIWNANNGDNSSNQKFVSNTVNAPMNVYNSCFTNMYQYSARGKLVRAFPAFLFCILDDQAQWYDGRKLWTNYYVYQSVIDIQVHQTNDMPTETAVITITNSAHNLSKTQAGLTNYSIRNDKAYFNDDSWFGRRALDFYNWTGLVVGGIKITDMLIDLHQKLYNHARLREGARIHLRMGYGSDPFSLAPMINGHISDITVGDQITMVVTSDGHEMIQSITCASEKGKVDTGWLGLFGLGATQESSNIIAKMMVERASWLNHLFGPWFESSKYGIEHFGIYFHNHTFFMGGVGEALDDLWNEAKEHWDILMNVYIANYKRQLYVCDNAWDVDGESNFSFNKYNMTPWDVTELCTQQVPEYICKCLKHQFDSRLFFGLPSYMERYRYDFFGGEPTMGEAQQATTTIKGSALDNAGKFNENANKFDSSPQGEPKNGEIKEIKFNVQMDKNHTNGNKKDPDKVTIKLYDKNNNFLQEHIVFQGNLLGTEHSFSLSPVRKDAAYATFHVYVPPTHKGCCKKAELDWEIIYEYSETTTETKEPEMKYNDILFEECKAAGQVHYLDSMTNIIDNQIRVTSKFSNTNVKCIYVRGGQPVTTATFHSDDSIDPAYQKTVIVDTPIVQDALGPDALWEFFGYQIGQRSAERVGISTLLHGWQQQYQGEILLFGSPGIRPHDYIMVNDVFSDMYGLSICREVIHSFNSSSGYTTSVTPGMIGFDTKENSGLIVHTQNLLATLNAFAILMQSRLANIHFVEQYITNFSQQLTVLNHACELLSTSQDWNTARDVITPIANIATFTAMALRMYHVCKSAGGIVAYGGKIFSAVKAGFSGLSAAKNIVQGAGIIAKGLGTSGTNAAAAALGISNPVGWAITIAVFLVDKLIGVFLDYISNKNVVVLLPMYWENYPYVSGVKDGEKILLMGNNATATNQNDKSDGHENAAQKQK